MCIKDPNTGELITDNTKPYIEILSKKPVREEDRKEHEEKVRNHNRIMNTANVEEWSLDNVTYNKVLRRMKEEGKNPINNSGNKYKEAIMQ